MLDLLLLDYMWLDEAINYYFSGRDQLTGDRNETEFLTETYILSRDKIELVHNWWNEMITRVDIKGT